MTPPIVNPDEELAITLPFSALRILIWGDERLDEIRPHSPITGDTAKVKITPLVLGELIANIDTKEDFIHVEPFPTHAELWLSFEWRESNSRRSRFKEQCAKERQVSDIRKSRIAELKAQLDPNLPDAVATNVAQTMLENIAKLDITHDHGGILKALNVLDTLRKYAKEETINAPSETSP